MRYVGVNKNNLIYEQIKDYTNYYVHDIKYSNVSCETICILNKLWLLADSFAELR